MDTCAPRCTRSLRYASLAIRIERLAVLQCQEAPTGPASNRARALASCTYRRSRSKLASQTVKHTKRLLWQLLRALDDGAANVYQVTRGCLAACSRSVDLSQAYGFRSKAMSAFRNTSSSAHVDRFAVALMLQACAVCLRIGRPSQHFECCDQMLGPGLNLSVGSPQPSARRTISIGNEATSKGYYVIQVLQHDAQRLALLRHARHSILISCITPLPGPTRLHCNVSGCCGDTAVVELQALAHRACASQMHVLQALVSLLLMSEQPQACSAANHAKRFVRSLMHRGLRHELQGAVALVPSSANCQPNIFQRHEHTGAHGKCVKNPVVRDACRSCTTCAICGPSAAAGAQARSNPLGHAYERADDLIASLLQRFNRGPCAQACYQYCGANTQYRVSDCARAAMSLSISKICIVCEKRQLDALIHLCVD